MKTNDLRFTATKHTKKETFVIKIRLSDECKNGHQDFSITGSIYEKGKPMIDKYCLCSGAIGDEIEKKFPKFAIFNKLHLCDFNGAPMYPEANGLYHMQNGFNSKSTKDAFKAEYCNYYRITPEQFDELRFAVTKDEFSILLLQLGIIEQWKAEAKEGIKLLEKLTRDEFLNDSKRSQYTEPTPEQIEEFNRLKATGYYSIEAKQKRAIEANETAKQKKIADLKETAKGKIDSINKELNLKIYVLESGLSIDNMIYYNHTNELVFNWQNYGKQISENDFNYFVENADYSKLPEGIKITRK